MKKFGFLIAALVMLSLSSYAESDSLKALKNAPVIEFTELTHDYGTIKQQADGSCEFVFKNNGKTPLILSNVQSSCGCTVPQWTREPIKKGESGTIKVKYNTNNVGPFMKSITVYSNATNNPIRLTIKGTVEAAAAAAQ